VSTVVPLASGPITPADQLSVELIQAIETPDMILIRWPTAPTVSDPRRFPVAAVAVIAILDDAMKRLAAIKAGDV
jgi:hypothetical protein